MYTEYEWMLRHLDGINYIVDLRKDTMVAGSVKESEYLKGYQFNNYAEAKELYLTRGEELMKRYRRFNWTDGGPY